MAYTPDKWIEFGERERERERQRLESGPVRGGGTPESPGFVGFLYFVVLLTVFLVPVVVAASLVAWLAGWSFAGAFVVTLLVFSFLNAVVQLVRD